MTRNQTIIAILNRAIAILWDGHNSQDIYGNGKQEFGCHAVSYAGLFVTTGVEADQAGLAAFRTAQDLDEAKELHAKISKAIKGNGTAYTHMVYDLGIVDPTSPDVQAFRKTMLNAILAEYKQKAALEEQIRILEAVKVMRTGTDYFHNFVCWNVDSVLNEQDTSEGNTIKTDIDEYINGHATLRWMMEARDGVGYENSHPRVIAERMEMVETLLARYKAELEGEGK